MDKLNYRYKTCHYSFNSWNKSIVFGSNWSRYHKYNYAAFNTKTDLFYRKFKGCYEIIDEL